MIADHRHERVVAVVPIRSFRNGKSRLATVLDRDERESLLRRTAACVVAAARHSGVIATTLVVSPDADALAWAAELGPEVIPLAQPATSPGLNGAIDAGREWALAAGAEAVISVFADLPFLSADDIREMVVRPEAVVLGPDRRGEGTNALLMRLAGDGAEFRFAFGEGSLVRHLDEARRLGLETGIFRAAGVAFDLDTPGDWSDYLGGVSWLGCGSRAGPDAVRSERRVSDGGEVRIIGIDGLPEVVAGNDLAGLIGDAIAASGAGLEAGDVVVVTHKIVSKAEGQVVDLTAVEPSALAARFGERWGKDPRKIEVVLREARRIVRMHNGLIIAETAHGFVCANAGVDASNAAPDAVVLLPKDPDASAAKLRAALMGRFGFGESDAPAVVVSDSFGRPWRQGIVNVAAGVSGMAPLVDYRGETDAAGYELSASIMAVADEVASAAELVMHKLAGRPVAIVRGYRSPLAGAPGTGRDLIMDAERDLFR